MKKYLVVCSSGLTCKACKSESSERIFSDLNEALYSKGISGKIYAVLSLTTDKKDK